MSHAKDSRNVKEKAHVRYADPQGNILLIPFSGKRTALVIYLL
jgi:hypothetical protein